MKTLPGEQFKEAFIFGPTDSAQNGVHGPCFMWETSFVTFRRDPALYVGVRMSGLR
jgi:hypothetical protein